MSQLKKMYGKYVHVYLNLKKNGINQIRYFEKKNPTKRIP